MKILDALLVLKEQALTDNVYYTDFGICYNLNEIVDEDVSVYEFVSNNSEDWEHHSGVYEYPVKLSNNCDLWEGEQLELRLSLLDHLIAKARELGV